MKMQTINGEYVIYDRGRVIIFKEAYDAWQYIFLCREIRAKVDMGERSLYPVRSLNPVPESRKKNVVFGDEAK